MPNRFLHPGHCLSRGDELLPEQPQPPFFFIIIVSLLLLWFFVLFILLELARASCSAGPSERALICSYCAKSVKLKLQILRLEFILHGRIIILSGGLRKLLHLDNSQWFLHRISCEIYSAQPSPAACVCSNIFQYWICIIF